eukprot:10770371-Prorocentrum_lima.AAC.1
MWGLKDAPLALSMRLSRSLQEIGYQHGVTDKQIWRKFDQGAKPVTGTHWIPSTTDKPHLHAH